MNTYAEMLHSDLDNLQNAIDQVRNGIIKRDAAKIRFYAAHVSRSMELAGLPRETKCTWDLQANKKEREAAKATLDGKAKS